MKAPIWIVLGFASASGLVAQPSGAPPTSAATVAKTPRPLSQAALDKIAAMTPIFDGKTLDGWIQAPVAPVSISGGDFTDLPAVATKLAGKTDALSAFLAGQFDDAGKAALEGYASEPKITKTFTSVLVKNLKRIMAGPSLFDPVRFQNIRLRPDTAALHLSNPQGLALLRLNRMLLEDAYPDDLVTSPLVSWTVKDGALASTGAGRGVLYTKGDYTHYRIIFDVRHVSGKPDHQPCVLVFCARPDVGTLGLDALGGIQFQVPNGGHWDYRPGHNNGGVDFKNPVKPKFDNHEWCQVEILVNAKDGTARMAVSQQVGTAGVENLDFDNPAAGKTGPFALQMHNAGLFDEYKDLRIEWDPKEDRLITVE